ncbi:MAG: WD40 repeat domain-containing protein, partial [Planctomycetes bacterium]|nr:WD40 repeat domain-containing protein [Planctomycetota bacterium]
LGINEPTGNTGIISVNPPVNNETPAANTGTEPNSNSPDANSNTPPDNGTEPGPSTESEDEAITKQLTDANSIVTSATTLEELEKAKNTLASIKIEYGRLSESQRTEYDRIRTRFDKRLALYTARELNDQVQVEIAKATDIWPTDLNKGIAALNKAINAKNKLDAMALPTEIEQALADERETQADAVAAALQVARELLFDDATKLAKAGNYDEADSRMASYERIHLSDEVKLEVAGHRASFQVKALIQRADAQLALDGFAKAGKAIDEADAKATTEDLRGEVKQARERVTAAVAGAFDKHMLAVDSAVADNEFETAKNEIDRAQELPLSTDQLVQLATRTFMVNVSSHIANTESAIGVDAFKEAAESLAAAEKEIADGGEKELPAETTTRLENARSLFETELQARFSSLLETARENLTDSKFADAAADIGVADKLPLNETQRATLDTFRDQNKQALEDYVASLIADIEKALDANDFESARLKLEEEKSLRVPEDLKSKLEELRARFATAALARHADLLANARSALEDKRYEATRKALDELVSIPVDEDRTKETTALEKQYWDDLTADVTAHLAATDKKLEDEDFESAKAELDAANRLPLSTELERKVRLKRTKWEEDLENTFADKLARAIKSCSNKLFKTGGKILKEAEKLPLSQAQLLRLSDAQDAHKKALYAHIDALFKQLEEHIAAGKEREGKITVSKLERLVISLTHQMKLKRLSNALTGESSSNRLKRLPDRLRNWFGDKTCASEQLMSLGEVVSALYISPDGKFAAAGTESGKVAFYNLKRGTKLGTSRGGRRTITAIAISPDGKRAGCGNDDGDLVSFTLSGSSIQTKAMNSLDDDISSITYGTGKNSLWVLTDEGEINRYNPKTGAKVSTTTSGIYTATTISISPDNKYVAVGGEDAEIALFSVDRMVFKKKLQGPGSDTIQRISFSTNSRKLVAGSESDGVAVWDIRKLTKDPIMKFEGLPQLVRGVGFSADGSRVIALDDEYQIRVFDTKTGKKLKTIKYEDFKSEDLDVMVTSGFVSSDGTIMLGTEEGEIYHFTVKNAK